MQPVHKCSQDCETLHKEISKKIILILINSRLIPVNEISTISNKNNWVKGEHSKWCLFIYIFSLDWKRLWEDGQKFYRATKRK